MLFCGWWYGISVLGRYLVEWPTFLDPQTLYGGKVKRFWCFFSFDFILLFFVLEFQFPVQPFLTQTWGIYSPYVDFRPCVFIIHITNHDGLVFESFGLFLVNLFFTSSNLSFFHPTNFIWKSKVPLEVDVFTWLVANMKVNTKDMLQKKRPCKIFPSKWYTMCKRSWESMDHLFFFFFFLCIVQWHWHYDLGCLDLLRLTMFHQGMWWRCLTIAYQGFGSLLRGK